MDEDVAARYFPPSSPQCPTFVDDSQWHPLIDGAAYFAELAELVDSAGAGDTVWIAGLELDPSIDLAGRSPDDPGYRPLGELLAQLAARGVDVRVLLACRVLAASIPGTILGGFRATALHADTLRSLRPPGTDAPGRPPLAARVLLDYSGLLLGSNHQKIVVAHVGGRLTAFVGGIDLVAARFEASPHDRLRLKGEQWGWHDMAVRLRGRAADAVWDVFGSRWYEASALPRRRYLRRPAPPSPSAECPGTAVRVMRSRAARKLDSVLPWRRAEWLTPPPTIVHEIFDTLTTALQAARRYIYLEDQYLCEANGGLGGNAAFELYPYLRAAAERGVKVVLVGSGTRDPEDTGIHLRAINRVLNRDIKTKIIDRLDDAHRANVVVYRVNNVTVHSKLVVIDDVFACIGSANMFSRSMAGTDSELSAAVATTTTLVRDLRVAAWAEHLRAPLTTDLRSELEDLDIALGIWRDEWRSPGAPPRVATPGQALRLVGP
jgi:phosphatidylserine/phosphatidylglycerophosphate/cardiolipin synthase-like enzyme